MLFILLLFTGFLVHRSGSLISLRRLRRVVNRWRQLRTHLPSIAIPADILFITRVRISRDLTNIWRIGLYLEFNLSLCAEGTLLGEIPFSRKVNGDERERTKAGESELLKNAQLRRRDLPLLGRYISRFLFIPPLQVTGFWVCRKKSPYY